MRWRGKRNDGDFDLGVCDRIALEYDLTTIIKVFVASPGDIKIEREIVRETIRLFSREVGQLFDVTLLPTGWEDVSSGVDRPQARINQLIHECDLFLGLFGARWGSNTGDFSSGTEEEYRLAYTLNQSHGRPDIGLYFKKIDAAQLADPGEQITRGSEIQKKYFRRKEDSLR